MCVPVPYLGNFDNLQQYDKYLAVCEALAGNVVPRSGGAPCRCACGSCKVEAVRDDSRAEGNLHSTHRPSLYDFVVAGGGESKSGRPLRCECVGIHCNVAVGSSDDASTRECEGLSCVAKGVADVGPGRAGCFTTDSKGAESDAGGSCQASGGRRMSSARKNQKEKARRRRKKERNSGVSNGNEREVDLPSVEIPAVVGRNGKPVTPGGVGFWKSCSEETRLKLIESKAQMHISENLRKAKENENRIEYLNSTQAIVDQVTMLVSKAEEMAKSANDNRVIGWARTVTSSSAESLAKTVPESVPSLSSYASEADASELDKVKRALAEEKEIVVAEYKLRHDRMRTTLDEKVQENEKLKADIAAIKRKPVVEASGGGRDKNLMYSIRSIPMSEVERAAVTHGVVTDVELVAARVRFGRQVTGDDFLAHSSGFNISTTVAGKIAEAYERQIGKFKRNQVPYNFLN